MNNLDLFLNEIQNIELQITPFNYALYYELYPELKQQKICTFLTLYQHYLKQGKSENRIANYSDFYEKFPSFDYNFYINSNKDLINTIQIKYSSKLETITEAYKEHFAIVHYFLYGQYQNKLINPSSLLTVSINPNNLPTALSFLTPPQLGNETIANICYQEYTMSNVVIIDPITEDLLAESNIGSVLFVDNTFPLNVSYSKDIRIINGNLFVKNANINTISINTIENDLQILGNLNITGNIYSNSIVNHHLTTHYNYTNSYVYQDTFSILGNLEVSTELSLNDYVVINFTGEYGVTDTFFSFSTLTTLNFNLIDLDVFTIEFNLKVNDISTETQTIFGCDNFEINLNLFNQIEIKFNDVLFSGITQILPDTVYFITITNTNLFINGISEITLNLDKINTSTSYLGKNTIVNLLLSDFRISNTVRYTDNFTVVIPFIIDKYTIILSEINNNKLIFNGYSKIFTVNNTGISTDKCVINELISETANIKLINNFSQNSNIINTIEIISNKSTSNSCIVNELISSNLVTENILITSNIINIENINTQNLKTFTSNIDILNSNNIYSTKGQFNELVTSSNLIITSNEILNLNNLNGNIIFGNNSININCDLEISGNTVLDNVYINNVKSDLFGEKEIFNNYGYLYGSTLLLHWGYYDIPVNSIFNFGLAEPGNDTGYSGSQFSAGFAIQNNPIINNSARLILRCQDISYNYDGTIGPKNIALAICQLRYQGDTSCTPVNGNLSTTYIDITEPFFCNTESTKGYFTVVSPFFNLINLDVPTLGLRIISMTNNGKCMRLGPTYLQLK